MTQPAQSKQNTFLQRQDFEGIEAMQEGVKDATVEPTQISRGAFRGSLLYAGLGEGVLTSGSLQGDIGIRGPLSETDHTLGVMIEAQGRTTQWGNEVALGDVGVFPPGVEHQALYTEKSTYAVVTLAGDVLSEITDSVGLAGRYDPFKDPAMHRPDASLSRLIVTTTRKAIGSLITNPKIATDTEACAAMLDDLVIPMLTAAANANNEQTVADGRNLPAATRIVQKAEEYLHANLHRPVRTRELCDYLQISVRSLNRVFNYAMDCSPSDYLRRWRLTRVRCLLTDPQHRDSSVTDIALRYGFWELGRFSQQYSRMFGELPSVTARKVRHKGTA